MMARPKHIERQILALVQFIPVKAGAAQRIAGRGHEQKHGLELLRAKHSLGVLKRFDPHDHLVPIIATIPSMYSAQVLDHFQNPRFVGDLENATVAVETQNPACGDVLRLSLRIEDGRIVEVRFRAKGCVPSIACGSKLAEMLNGREINDPQIQREQIINQLGGLPEASEHASHLAMDALRAAIAKINS